MIGKQVNSKIAWYEQSNIAVWLLHFYIPITRFIKSGNVFSIKWWGETYKLLSAYPPSPQRMFNV